MTLEIGLVFGILLAAIVLFVTEVLRPDLTALLVLVGLTISGLVTPAEAISGFSNPAVVTIWAVFILSAGLSRTGVAAALGAQVLRFAGKTESRLITILMGGTALLSGFMNNIGVAAMFLPVTVDIARRTQRAVSRLLLPMAYGSLLGGMLVLIGTASNLVVSDFLREAGLPTPGLFDFTPVGLAILIVSILYMKLIGRRLLPRQQVHRPVSDARTDDRDQRKLYGLEERLAMLTLPNDSALAGKTLAESRISRALGLNVLSIERGFEEKLGPDADLVLEGGDRLLALGRLDQLDRLVERPVFTVRTDVPAVQGLLSENIGLAEFAVGPSSELAGRTLAQTGFRRKSGVNVLAVRRGDVVRRTKLQHMLLESDDRLLVEGAVENLSALSDLPGFRELGFEEAGEYHLEDRLLFLDIPENSSLAGRTLAEARLGDVYGISVLNIIRGGEERPLPDPETRIESGDRLIVSGHPTDIEVLGGLQSLQIRRDIRVDLAELETGPQAIVEVMLSPYTTVAGKTLRDLRFREKFGISVLAVWRGDRSYRTGLADFPLQYGDALLCYGPIERFEILARERDYVVLRLDVQEKPRFKKAPLASLIMLTVIAIVMLNWLPISIAAIAGAAFMVMSRCLTMDQAYRAIEWKAVFLIAAMLPMGHAMQQTGAAQFLASGVISAAGPFGPTAVLAGLMTLTLAVNPLIPSAANAVVMSPIALAAAFGLGVSPYPFIMAVAYAVAAGFMTPVSHPVNVLVMSPGGYRFSDYMKNGLPISLIVLLMGILLLPVVFPF